MAFDVTSILAYSAGLLLTVLFFRLFFRPLKWLLKVLLNGIIGGLILVAINLVGGFAGLTVIITPLSALLAGFLGIPGIALTMILQNIL